MKSHFGGAGQRRLRSDEKRVPKPPTRDVTCYYAECATCHMVVIAANDAYWDFGLEAAGWLAHKHQPAGDDDCRKDPLHISGAK